MDAQCQEETRQFWCITSEIRKLCRDNTDQREADEAVLWHLEELEMIAMYTLQPLLKLKCNAFIAEFTAERTPAAFG